MAWAKARDFAIWVVCGGVAVTKKGSTPFRAQPTPEDKQSG